MKYASIFITAITVGALLYTEMSHITKDVSHVPHHIRAHFLRWKVQQSKFYQTPSEDNYRLSVFHKNVLHINAHNARSTSFKMAVNKFADLTSEEFTAMYASSLTVPETEEEVVSNLETGDLPATVDWTKKGAVTPIGNTGPKCHTAWAFSAAGAMEGLRAIQGHGLIKLSEQQLVDCTRPYSNYGCAGGYAYRSFKYVIKNGIQTYASYPYTAQDGTCHGKLADKAYQIQGYHIVPKYNNPQLLAAVAQQPTTTVVDATGIQFYKSGVLDHGCTQNVSHTILLVGYGTDKIPYWKAKNCWGKDWGENGYLRVQRAIPNGAPSECGVGVFCHYPTGGHL